ncbi:MAG: hypothetical protein L3K26_20540, partial [Candidatus Hydrogenedentes bacterium]|nr:hypothetical protein [Candidatus Hydrogenedentota bacterium]
GSHGFLLLGFESADPRGLGQGTDCDRCTSWNGIGLVSIIFLVASCLRERGRDEQSFNQIT